MCLSLDLFSASICVALSFCISFTSLSSAISGLGIQERRRLQPFSLWEDILGRYVGHKEQVEAILISLCDYRCFLDLQSSFCTGENELEVRVNMPSTVNLTSYRYSATVVLRFLIQAYV